MYTSNLDDLPTAAWDAYQEIQCGSHYLTRDDFSQICMLHQFLAVQKHSKGLGGVYLERWERFYVASRMRNLLEELEVEDTKSALPKGPQGSQRDLDLQWVIGEDLRAPWTILTSYERYIIYLKYREDLSIIQIAKRLHKCRQTIQIHLEVVLDRLRRIIYAQENTRGSCKRRDGFPT